jgi:hypothetical protein
VENGMIDGKRGRLIIEQSWDAASNNKNLVLLMLLLLLLLRLLFQQHAKGTVTSSTQ